MRKKRGEELIQLGERGTGRENDETQGDEDRDG